MTHQKPAGELSGGLFVFVRGTQLLPAADGEREFRNDPLRHGFAVPPLPKGRGFGRGEKFMGLQVRFF